MEQIDATVLELETPDPRAARVALQALPEVESVAQLGTRLHALVDPALAEPQARLRDALGRAGVAAPVRVVEANLEDVFVAATRRTPASDARA
jgi:ABC-2 type transport system ATP-binding protein